MQRFTTDRGHIALVDGSALGIDASSLVRALEAHDDAFLSRLHGHFSALVLRPDGGIRGYCDRFGARTIYWQNSRRHGTFICSRWEDMPVFDNNWDAAGLSEAMRYRTTSGQKTLLASVSRLPHRHRFFSSPDGVIRVLPAAQQIDWPRAFEPRSFASKLAETRKALDEAMGEVAPFYDRAAIFLSGGVDSSLLAALAKLHFKRCLLVSTEFPGECNPELPTAKAFAEALGLEHLIVRFDVTRIERDLRSLVGANGAQINFHVLAMHQMIEAIPEEYKLLIYGEKADTLFGFNGFRQAHRNLCWKRNADLVPAMLLKWLSRIPLPQAARLVQLKESSALDIALQTLRIQYNPASMAIVRALCDADIDELYAHRAMSRYPLGRHGRSDLLALRQLLAGIVFHAPDHYQQVELSAARFGKQIFTPFTSEAVVTAAKTLTNEQYFGGDFPKPVLRELACKFFERKLIYRKKQGFEVPFISWLKGPLAHLVESARSERRMFDGRIVESLNVDEHYPLLWSLISWQLVNEEVLARTVRIPPLFGTTRARPAYS